MNRMTGCGPTNQTPATPCSDSTKLAESRQRSKRIDVGWQNNIQADTTTNPTFAKTHNDGGGSYQPNYVDAFDYYFLQRQ